MADTVFHAERRERAGKGAARAARRAGLVPGVIYGAKQAPTLVSLDPRELQPLLRSTGFYTNLYDVQVNGATEKVLVRDVQLHPVSDKPIHIDFMRVDPNTKVTVEVPVVFENGAASPGIKRGGVLNIVRHEIEIVCLAARIPHEIRVDLTGLDIGDSVHIRGVKLPEGVRPAISRDFTIASVAAPSTMAVEVETVAPEVAAPVEVITAKETKEKEKEGAEAGKEPGKEAAKPEGKKEAKPEGKKEAKPEGKKAARKE